MKAATDDVLDDTGSEELQTPRALHFINAIKGMDHVDRVPERLEEVNNISTTIAIEDNELQEADQVLDQGNQQN